MENIPPPPYSETDIYSRSGDHHSTGALSHHGDDSVSRVSSSSTGGDVIYTPPLTPRTSNTASFHSEPSTPNDAAPRVATAQSTGNNAAVPEYQPPPRSAATTAYFEARPGPAVVPLELIDYPLTLRPSSTPDDYAYDAYWATRDVTPQDWQTFLNFMIPHHAGTRNDAVIDRKIRAESERGSTAALSEHGAGFGDEEDDEEARERETTSSSIKEAQLDQIRHPSVEDDDAQRLIEAAAAVHEWNEGFFGPRGMNVRLIVASADGAPRMPGAWDQDFESGEAAPGTTPVSGNRGGGGNNNGFSIGGIVMDEEGFRIGDTIHAGRNGLRIGNLRMDSNGINYNGNPLFRGGADGTTRQRGMPGRPGFFAGPWGGRGAHHHGPSGPHHHGPHHGEPRGGPFGGRRGGPFVSGGGFAGGSHNSFVPGGGPSGERRGGRGEGRFEGRRGRKCRRDDGDGKHRVQRSHSSSSTSSSSSESSESSVSSHASSESSIGSLPDYDDIRGPQLPLFRSRIQAWLQQSGEKLVTRADVKQLKTDLKTAKEQQKVAEGSGADPDRAAVKAEVKALAQDFKKLKRRQKELRKQRRREKKAARDAVRRVKREQKRQAKQQKRQAKEQVRQARDQGREAERQARGFAREMSQQAKEAARQASQQAKEMARQANQRAREEEQQRREEEQMRREVEQMRREEERMPGGPGPFGVFFGAPRSQPAAPYAPGPSMPGGFPGSMPQMPQIPQMPAMPGIPSMFYKRGRGGDGAGGRGFGRGGWGGMQAERGPGFRGMGFGYGQDEKMAQFPGTWPGDDEQGHEEGLAAHDAPATAASRGGPADPSAVVAHAASRAIYQAADQLENQAVQRRERLQRLREEQEAARSARADEGPDVRFAPQIMSLEAEIRALEENVDKLRFEGDATFAGELERIENGY